MTGLQMKYFVLNPNKENPYGRASRIAILAYARSIRKENRGLAKDLEKWIATIELGKGVYLGKVRSR